MPKIQLADLQAAVEKKYEPIELEDGTSKAVLQTLMLLPKEKRKEYAKRAKAFNAAAEEEDADQADLAIDLLAIVADDAKALRKILNGANLGVLLMLVEQYSEATQPGEASGSPS